MDVTATAVAEKLLQENFLLTALEFHAELAERGKELKLLRDFFSNPTNFENIAESAVGFDSRSSFSIERSGSQATLDSFDGIRLHEPSCDETPAASEKIALLEFELRKAQDLIKSLRLERENGQNDHEDHGCSSDGDDIGKEPAPWELRVVNSLVNNHLSTHGHKLASVAFAEGADMASESDLKRCRANSLIAILRAARASGANNVDHATPAPLVNRTDCGVQTDQPSPPSEFGTVPEKPVVPEIVEDLAEESVHSLPDLVERNARLTSSPLPTPTLPDEAGGSGKLHPVSDLRKK
jgi:hypothetical protein